MPSVGVLDGGNLAPACMPWTLGITACGVKS